MAALIPDKILIGVVSLNFFLPIKMQHVIHGTSAATYNQMEVNRNVRCMTASMALMPGVSD